MACQDKSNISSIFTNPIVVKIKPKTFNAIQFKESYKFWPTISVNALKKEKSDNVEYTKNFKTSEHYEKIRNTNFKIKCKYRKSCYKNPESFQSLKKNVNANKFKEKLIKIEKNKENTINENAKLLCKYRYSCYVENKLENLLKDQEKVKKYKSILISKSSQSIDFNDKVEKSLTVQEMAEIAIEELKKQNKNALEKINLAEEYAQNIKDKLKQKVDCKYRKSCYDSGKLPEISKSKFFVWYKSLEDYVETVKMLSDEEIFFEKLDDNKMKLYCKYRPSCYKNGIKPKIGKEERFHFKEIIENIKEKKEKPLKERCKYRISCYKTGVLPEEFNSQASKNLENYKSSKSFPTTIDELKLFCKYRKSCYLEKAKNNKTSKKHVLTENINTKKENEEPSEDTLIEKVHITKEQKTEEGKKSISKKNQKKVKNFVLKTSSPTEKVAKNLSDNIKPKINDAKKTAKKDIRRPKIRSPVSISQKLLNNSSMIKEKNTNKEILKRKKMLQEEKKIKKNFKDEVIQKEDLLKLKEKTVLEDTKDEIENIFTPTFISTVERLKCKYRKSCYRISKLKNKVKNIKYQNKTKQENSNILITPINPIKEWEKRKRNEMLKCKYRKSCYPSMEVIEDKKISSENSTLTNLKKNIIRKVKHNNPVNKNSQKKKVDIIIEEQPIVLTPELKVLCKYRQSCYKDPKNWDILNIQDKQFILDSHIPMNSTMTKCNKYYLSCREKLGLPLKEKAPFGANGKKLCRKKS